MRRWLNKQNTIRCSRVRAIGPAREFNFVFLVSAIITALFALPGAASESCVGKACQPPVYIAGYDGEATTLSSAAPYIGPPLTEIQWDMGERLIDVCMAVYVQGAPFEVARSRASCRISETGSRCSLGKTFVSIKNRIP